MLAVQSILTSTVSRNISEKYVQSIPSHAFIGYLIGPTNLRLSRLSNDQRVDGSNPALLLVCRCAHGQATSS